MSRRMRGPSPLCVAPCPEPRALDWLVGWLFGWCVWLVGVLVSWLDGWFGLVECLSAYPNFLTMGPYAVCTVDAKTRLERREILNFDRSDHLAPFPRPRTRAASLPRALGKARANDFFLGIEWDWLNED